MRAKIVSPKRVKIEEEELNYNRIHILGRNGGYILGPSHAIQSGTPPENIVAMFDTAIECRSEG